MKLLRRLQYLRHRRRLDAELAEEMEFHRGMIESSGAPRAAMGNVTLAREASRGVWLWPWLESILQDLAYAARNFRRQPAFAAIAIVVLALSIGLNTSLFTVFNAIAFRPWSVPDPGRMVHVLSFARNPPRGFDNVGAFGPAEFRYLAAHTKSIGLFFTRGEGGLHLDQSKIRPQFASASFFGTLGIGMEQGRGFLPDEDRPAAPVPVAVLSYALWQSRLGGDPSIVGRTVRIEQIPFTVVGIAPADFGGTETERTDLWLPLASMTLIFPGDSWVRSFLERPNQCCGDVFGRLAPGVTREQASAELSLFSADFRRQNKIASDGVILTGTALLQQPGRKTRQLRGIFGLMFTGVMLVLLLACANVGNLLLARAAARRREIGVRLSLGAGRARVVRQLLTESLGLAAVAGAIGMAIAWTVPGPLFRSIAGDLSLHLTPDTTVLVFTLALTVLASLVFGLAPALHATRDSLSRTMQRHTSRARFSLRSLLLAVQVAVSVILLAGAGLLIRGIQHVRAQDPGFTHQDIAAVSLELPAGVYRAPALKEFYGTIAHGLDALTSAVPYGFSGLEPLGNARAMTSFRLPRETGEPKNTTLTNTVSPGYFDVLHIPIVAGRNFTAADPGHDVVIINQALADRFFPGENPIGKQVVTGTPQEIVGVVRNAHTVALDSVDPTLYTPISYGRQPVILLHNTPANLTALEALVKAYDSRVQLQVHQLSRNVDSWLESARVGASIAGVLGLLALTLASIGVSGAFAYAVQQQTKEIGIRMALGARPAQVAGSVVGPAARSLLFGLIAGLAGALAGSALIRPYLFGLNRLDAATYAAVLLALAFAGMVAAWLPARRAMRVDVIQALHYE